MKDLDTEMVLDQEVLPHLKTISRNEQKHKGLRHVCTTPMQVA